MNVDISKHYDLQMINEELKCILHNECGYFKTLWFANDKWGLKCILHNECGYFKTLWLANDKWWG